MWLQPEETNFCVSYKTFWAGGGFRKLILALMQDGPGLNGYKGEKNVRWSYSNSCHFVNDRNFSSILLIILKIHTNINI